MKRVGDANAQREYYLTDVPEILLAGGAPGRDATVQAVASGDVSEVLGVNTFFVMVCVISALLVWRHKENISRLIAGTESRIGGKKA